MRHHPTRIDGIKLIELDMFRDSRGYFRETYRKDAYSTIGISELFPQSNHSHSTHGVLRGLHYRLTRPQSQLVTVLQGHVYDVVVDIRPASPTFGSWLGVHLGLDSPHQQIYMAPGFAHGFCVLSRTADLYYMVSETYDESDEFGIAWDDPELGIAWPISEPLVSSRDARHPTFTRSGAMFGSRS